MPVIFVVMRDLRDSLISAYFSFKISHPVIAAELGHWRSVLNDTSKEDGLVYLMDQWLVRSARIQASWGPIRRALHPL